MQASEVSVLPGPTSTSRAVGVGEDCVDALAEALPRCVVAHPVVGVGDIAALIQVPVRFDT